MDFPCFWALLSYDDLNFLYISKHLLYSQPFKYNQLINSNLIDLIHKDEQEMARKDFETYKNSNSLHGSTTRCRIMNLKTSPKREAFEALFSTSVSPEGLDKNTYLCKDLDPEAFESSSSESTVFKIMTNVLNKNTIFAFFHIDTEYIHNPKFLNCKCVNLLAGIEEKEYIKERLDVISEIRMKREISSEPITPTESSLDPVDTRCFLILDSITKSSNFVWPEKNYVNLRSVLQLGLEENQFKFDSLFPKDEIEKMNIKIQEFLEYKRHLRFYIQLKTHNPIYDIELVFYVDSFYSIAFVQLKQNKCHKPINYDYCNKHIHSFDTKRTHEANYQHSLCKTQFQIINDESNFVPDSMTDEYKSELNSTISRTHLILTEKLENVTLSSSVSEAKNFIQLPPIQEFKARINNIYKENQRVSDIFFSSSSNSNTQIQSASGELYSQTRREFPFPMRHLHEQRIYRAYQASNPKAIINLNKPSKTCTECKTTNSPEWRRGPNGHKSLCNACGLRYSRAIAKAQKLRDTTGLMP